MDKLQHGATQPFYEVFMSDASVNYVAHENLEPATPKDIREWTKNDPFRISDLGYFFSCFNGTRYIPNNELGRKYPEG